jgi:geranylgeranyl diphosphate synthase, type II
LSGFRTLQEYVDSRRSLVEAAIERFLPSPPACPPIIAEAMRYAVLGGGKRLRPILTLAAAEAVAGVRHGSDIPAHTLELALPAACAIEMIHTYSLVHDDLPAMDDDDLRRGRPTSHVMYGEGIAILVGDALLTEAFGLLAREPPGARPDLLDRKVRTVALIAQAAGACGMVGGQALDLQAVGAASGGNGPAALDAGDLHSMHARKTGALIRAAAGAGAIMGGGADPLRRAIDQYATELGLAFQIVDDILDVEGAAEALGKTAGKDAAAGKPTYPALYGLEQSRVLAAESVARARNALHGAGLDGPLAEIAEWVIARTH